MKKLFSKVILSLGSLILAWSILGNAVPVNAQKAPVNSPPIQRTIEAVGEESFSGPISSESGNTSARSAKAPLYGLAAIMLLLIAAGATYYIWTQNPGNAS